MKTALALVLSLVFIASACTAGEQMITPSTPVASSPTATSSTPAAPDSTTSAAPTTTAAIPTTTDSNTTLTALPPFTFVSPNQPADPNDPAIAAWILYPIILTPATVKAGQPVEVWTNIYMVDFLITFIVARLEVNGVIVDTAHWELYIDEPDAHCFVYTPPAPGIYNIRIIANLEENEQYNQEHAEQIATEQSATLVVT